MKERLQTLIPFFLFFTLATYFFSENFFFWDSIKIVSYPAHFFYENNFNQLFLPSKYDSGHIPAFSFYLAILWKLFSKSLIVSHFAMLPFVLGIIWQACLLIERFIDDKKWVILVLILTLLDPTFLSQSIMISADIPLLFFFLLGVNSFFRKKEALFSMAIIGLFLMSMRGMMLALVLLMVEMSLVVIDTQRSKIVRVLYKKSFKYLPGFLILVVFNFFHYKSKGWFFLNPGSDWVSGQVKNDLYGAFYNIGIYAWRLLDFGKVFLWVPLIILITKYRKEILQREKVNILMLYLVSFLFLFLLLFMKYKYYAQHRYLFPIYILISILTGYLISSFVKTNKNKRIVFALLFIGLLSGNFWVYPNKIAQGWDSSLARLPYYSLQKKMSNYLEAENISIEQVGSEFPNLGEQRYIMLNDNHLAFKRKEIGEDNYVLYSNINNDFTDEEIDLLASSYTLIKEFESFHVFVRLYKKS